METEKGENAFSQYRLHMPLTLSRFPNISLRIASFSKRGEVMACYEISCYQFYLDGYFGIME